MFQNSDEWHWTSPWQGLNQRFWVIEFLDWPIAEKINIMSMAAVTPQKYPQFPVSARNPWDLYPH